MRAITEERRNDLEMRRCVDKIIDKLGKPTASPGLTGVAQVARAVLSEAMTLSGAHYGCVLAPSLELQSADSAFLVLLAAAERGKDASDVPTQRVDRLDGHPADACLLAVIAESRTVFKNDAGREAPSHLPLACPELTNYALLPVCLGDGRTSGLCLANVDQGFDARLQRRLVTLVSVVDRLYTGSHSEPQEVANTPRAFVRIDQQGAIVGVNAVAERLLAWPMQVLIGQPISTFLPDIDLDGVFRAGAPDIHRSDRLRLSCRDGLDKWVGMRCCHRTTSRGGKQPVAMLQLSELGDAVEDAPGHRYVPQAHFGTFSRLAPVGVLHIGCDWSAFFVSDRWCDICAQARDDLLGYGWIDCFHEEDVAGLLLDLRNSVAEEAVFDRDLRISSKDGPPVWINLRASVTRNEDQAINGCLLVATDITDRRIVEQNLHRIAHEDPLTGLHNRARFHEHLEEIVASGSHNTDGTAALLFIDLDGFKSVNDTLGHDCGDELLCQVAVRLQDSVREQGVLARLGGDEFTVVLTECSDADMAMSVAEDIVQRLRAAFAIKDAEVFVSASVGVAIARAGELGAEEFIKQADVALYRAKASGRARCVMYSTEIDRQQRRQASLITRLRRAVDRREFHLVYQPQVGADGTSLLGFEALLRWHGEGSGSCSTEDVITVLENNGLISDVGQWAIEQACRQFMEWQRLRFVGPEVSMSVNVSARQLTLAAFVDRLQNILERTGMPAGNLVLELTESVLVDDEEEIIAVIRQIKALGVRIALDDFGTGYSSLSSLAQLPIDCLKIDRSFISALSTLPGCDAVSSERSIVNTIIALAAALRIHVVAEGVEHDEAMALLVEQNCSGFQGYLFSRPLMAAGVEAWLLRRSGHALAEWPNLIDLGVPNEPSLARVSA